MTAQELRDNFLCFMESKGHTIIPSASLVPENDASTLFTTAGMHPLVPYLMGEKHPGGTRVANVQKCVRTGDIDDVGDNRHLTFFEMMGNWSFGDYFKKEAIEWSFEFLTGSDWLGLDPKRLYVTTFKGEDGIPRDEESIEIWKRVFKEKADMEVEVAGEDEIIKDNVRIIPLGVNDNFWIAGATGPCGGDTEMFYDVRPEEGRLEGKFSELVDTFRILEIWNDVFMEFNKTGDGKYEKLAKQNVDTGMGVERTSAVLNGKENAFDTELFSPIFEKIEEISGKKYEENKKEFRIIADHLRATTFMLADGVIPSNTDRGYVLRRLIRRAVRYGKMLGIEKDFISQISEVVISNYGNFYKELEEKKGSISEEVKKEEGKFRKTLENGLKYFDIKVFARKPKEDGTFWSYAEIEENQKNNVLDNVYKNVFNLFQTYGFPLEMILEEAVRRNIPIDKSKLECEFKKQSEKHQYLSRTATEGKFKGGLADASVETTRLHTAAHLLLAALRKVLGSHVVQKGSNITAERLRFDFSHGEKMTPEQIKEVEDLVNEQIRKKIPVGCKEMTLDEAKGKGAMGVFESKYGERVKVYSVGDFSKEICGGPHVENTGELGHFKIKKEESSSAGVRRIKAILE